MYDEKTLRKQESAICRYLDEAAEVDGAHGLGWRRADAIFRGVGNGSAAARERTGIGSLWDVKNALRRLEYQRRVYVQVRERGWYHWKMYRVDNLPF